jgi:membrane associated rhomboid family serine protease
VRNLLLANIVVFFFTMAYPAVVFDLALLPAAVLVRPWTAITYMFIHANFSHLFFNMIGLYFFGSRVEARLGSWRFLGLYFVSGLTGALLSLFFTPFARVVGASGAIFGVMLGYARYWPRDLVYIWGLFPVQARWLVVAMTVLSLYGGFSPGGSAIAHFAHLGGFLGGLIYLTWVDRTSPAARFRTRAQASVAPGHRTVDTSDIERWKNIRVEGMHPLNRQELERLLEKVATVGASRLTPDERAFLDRMAG